MSASPRRDRSGDRMAGYGAGEGYRHPGVSDESPIFMASGDSARRLLWGYVCRPDFVLVCGLTVRAAPTHAAEVRAKWPVGSADPWHVGDCHPEGGDATLRERSE
jgi:hypothetical protein